MANPEDLGRYRLKRLLGRGVLGEVWEASDLEQEGRKVAVKILHAADDELAFARIQFAREARIAAHVRHPHLAQVLDAGEAAGTSFMVMQMIEGKPLRAVMREPSLPLEEKLRWLRQIGDALVTMHRTDLVHRDLKPENVIIRPDRSAVLVDLGLAKWTKFDLGGERDPLDEIEGTGDLKGPDPTYAPPEALEEELYDELGDQWAWGVLGYELLTGQRPEPGAPPLASRDDIPHSIGEALDKARTARREDRWDALELALDELGPGSMPILRVDPPPPPAVTEPPPTEPAPSVLPAPTPGPGRRSLSPLVLVLGFLLVVSVALAVVAGSR